MWLRFSVSAAGLSSSSSLSPDHSNHDPQGLTKCKDHERKKLKDAFKQEKINTRDSSTSCFDRHPDPYIDEQIHIMHENVTKSNIMSFGLIYFYCWVTTCKAGEIKGKTVEFFFRHLYSVWDLSFSAPVVGCSHVALCVCRYISQSHIVWISNHYREERVYFLTWIQFRFPHVCTTNRPLTCQCPFVIYSTFKIEVRRRPCL